MSPVRRLRFALLGAVLLLPLFALPAACGSADSYLVVRVEAPNLTTRVAQMRVDGSILATGAQFHIFVPTTKGTVTFPTSFALDFTSGVQGRVDIRLTGFDPTGKGVVEGTARADFSSTGTIQVTVTLAPATGGG